jgi:hypothetical protein
VAKRKPFSPKVQDAVLLECQRRCALCFFYSTDTRVKKRGQVAHIDNPADVRAENAAYLCTKHHDAYDSRSRQSKGMTPAELRRYKAALVEYISGPMAGPKPGAADEHWRGSGVSLEVFDRRVPTYRKTVEFLRYVCQITDLNLQTLMTFAREADESVFLFDDALADYLSLLFRKAMRLRAVSLILEAPERHTPELVDEQFQLSCWFTEQFEETRRRFVPFLRLTRTG